MKFALLATMLLTVLTFPDGVRAAGKPSVTAPVRPEALLAALPQAPGGWTLIRSNAETTRGESWQTRATRIFQAPTAVPANATASADPASAGAEVRVVLSDLGGRIPGDFTNFQPGKTGIFERIHIGSYPAIVVTREDRRLVRVLLANRYVAELTFVRLPLEKPETWLRAFNFEGLQNLPPVPLPAAGQVYVARFVDELHPARNRQHKVSTSVKQPTPSTE